MTDFEFRGGTMTETAAPRQETEVLFDPADPGLRRDPYPVYRRLREQAPTYRSPAGVWYFSRYADCFALFRDPALSYDPTKTTVFQATLSDEPGQRERQLAEFHKSRTVLEVDPPEHTRMRALFSRAFTPRALAEIAPVIDQLADELLDELDGPRIDLVKDFSIKLPVRVICEMLGVQAQEQERFAAIANALVRTVDPQVPPDERIAANKNMREYIAALVAVRRQHPGDDLMTRLIEAAADGRLSSEDELLSNTGLLLAAGFETTTGLVTNAVYQLITHPGERAALERDPELIRTAVEEVLRFDPPVHMMRPHTITADVTIGGAELHAGDAVAPLIAAANRDPAEFPDAETFDITRSVNRHMGFGLGHHMCVGAALARMETQAVVSRVFARFPGLALAADDEPTFRPHLSVRGFERLPVDLWLRQIKTVAML
jgi:cytochrome P450